MIKFENVTPRYANKTGQMTREEADMFCWGRVVAVHRIGEYEIIEYLDRLRDGCTILKTVGTEHLFHVNSHGCSCTSLDEALVSCIAYKYDGISSQAVRLFCKGIGMYDQKKA
jgi:hypothetical protein